MKLVFLEQILTISKYVLQQIKSVNTTKETSKTWHDALYGGNLLPSSELKIKAFCADSADLGFGYHTIMTDYYYGLCCWVSIICVTNSHLV